MGTIGPGTAATWDPAGNGLRAMGHLEVDPGWAHAPHRHAFPQLMLILGGDLRVVVDGTSFRAGPGDYCYYAIGVDHAETAGTRGCDLVYLALTGPLPVWPVTAHETDGRGRQVARWLVEEHRSPQERQVEREGALLHLLLEEFHRAAGHRLPVFVGAARAYMAEHLAGPIAVADLAAVAAMAPAHFGRRYKAATGMTPMADLRRLRIGTARDLLVSSDLPLKAIAARCGFCDEYHLSRTCHLILGHRPGWFRGGA